MFKCLMKFHVDSVDSLALGEGKGRGRVREAKFGDRSCSIVVETANNETQGGGKFKSLFEGTPEVLNLS